MCKETYVLTGQNGMKGPNPQNPSLLPASLYPTPHILHVIDSPTRCCIKTEPTHKVVNEEPSFTLPTPHQALHTSTTQDSPKISPMLVVSCQMFQCAADNVLPKSKTVEAYYCYLQKKSMKQLSLNIMSHLILILID